jgi:hypothetical protein
MVAIVVILYSLFGIATLLGYLPLSQGGAAPKQVQHPAMEARPSLERCKDREVAVVGGDSGCQPRPRLGKVPPSPSPVGIASSAERI